MKKAYTCMGCGFICFEDVFASWEICPICNLQDDLAPIRYPLMKFFDESLYQVQCRFLKKIPYIVKKYEKGGNTYQRNKSWRPIDKDSFDEEYAYLPKWKYDEHLHKYPNNSYFQYEVLQEAQKYNPDDKVHLDL